LSRKQAHTKGMPSRRVGEGGEEMGYEKDSLIYVGEGEEDPRAIIASLTSRLAASEERAERAEAENTHWRTEREEMVSRVLYEAAVEEQRTGWEDCENRAQEWRRRAEDSDNSLDAVRAKLAEESARADLNGESLAEFRAKVEAIHDVLRDRPVTPGRYAEMLNDQTVQEVAGLVYQLANVRVCLENERRIREGVVATLEASIASEKERADDLAAARDDAVRDVLRWLETVMLNVKGEPDPRIRFRLPDGRIATETASTGNMLVNAFLARKEPKE